MLNPQFAQVRSTGHTAYALVRRPLGEARSGSGPHEAVVRYVDTAWPRLKCTIATQAHWPPLDVLPLGLADGLRNISVKVMCLHMSGATTRKHREIIRRKLEICNSAKVAAYAVHLDVRLADAKRTPLIPPSTPFCVDKST